MPRSAHLSREQLIDRQAFQIALIDRLRGLDNPHALLAAAAEMLGQRLGAGRCGVAAITADGSQVRVDADWSDSLPGLAGETRLLDSFGLNVIAELRAGQTLVVEDSDTDRRVRDHAAGWASIQTRALIVVPILREGRLEGIFYVHDGAPRQWTLPEIALAEDVALRTREAADRAWSELELRASEARYRSLFNSIDAGFCVVEMKFDDEGRALDYRFLEVNESFTRQTGIMDPVGRWMRDIAPDHEQTWFDLYGRVARTGHSEQVELPAQALGDRWFLVHAYRVDAPHLNHVAILFTDLSDRRRAERALERSREELELAARAAELGRYDYRPREGTLVWDDRCRELFGLPPGAPVSYESAFLAGLHPDDRDRADRAVAAALDPDGSHRFEVEYRTIGIEDGKLRHVSAHGLAFFDGRDPIRLVGTVQDVSAEREADAARREVEERLRLAGRATNDAVWDWDLRANHVTWNEAIERNYGHCLTEVDPTGDWWIAHIHPDDRARISASIHAVIDGDGTDWSDEYRFARADGSYADILDRGYVLRGPDGAPLRMVGAMMDVSARKAVERQLERDKQRLTEEVGVTAAERDRAEEALRQAQKMEAVGQLTGGIAHDFNNLLTGISGALEMIQIRIQQGRANELEKYSTAAQGAVRRAAALTHRLLAFSRRQTLDPKPTNVNRLVRDLEDMIRRSVGPAIHLETVGQAGLWSTLVDPNQLENAILNLCINARDAMPGGGRITIETANRLFDDRAARDIGLLPGGYVSVAVTDTGTGMEPDVVSRAFDPFFTTKPMGQGTGLGLSMIYAFVRQSGGQVRIYTEVGAGTTMCLYLPRLEGADADQDVADPGPAARTDPPDPGLGTILVVDDEPTVRMLAVEVARDAGYHVLEAEDGPGALAILDQGHDIDLLITDVGLPGGLNGRQVADAALARIPALRVIFITGYAENAVLGSGQLAPNMALVTKPFAMDALADRIAAMMA
ncbi:PAS domain-containing protein [Sphingobium sp. CCH11-B1]|jgi:PAS domain S-box-containing protein|uniref:PAS domain-containing protein n=1 Tax=Sphingobium sp. CCH11-B1 TaxID=1768781 RepID=UPI00082EBB64|nr:PAS domain-containing protein [Sphingobium sp. CCH11-B1]MEA3391231.1 PAS domain-containing protein [Pseudomonadota bacterium]